MLAYVINPGWMAWSSFDAPDWLRWAGVVLGICVVPSVHWVLSTLGSNVSETVLTKDSHQLVSDAGPYRWIRHPLYTTGIALFLALGLMAASWFILALALVALVAIRAVVVPREERELIARFGKDYRGTGADRRDGAAFQELGDSPAEAGRYGESYGNSSRLNVTRLIVRTQERTAKMSDAMIMTTTPAIEGRRIVRYAGVVTGEAILGANIFKDLFAGIRDIVGGRSAAYEQELRRARSIALTEIRQAAVELGQMPSSGSISTTKPSAARAAC